MNKNKGCGFSLIKYLLSVIVGLFVMFIGNILLVKVGISPLSLLNQGISFIKGSGAVEDFTENIEKAKNKVEGAIADNVKSQEETSELKVSYTPLAFKNMKQLELGDYDSLGRATYSHIQLNIKDAPTDEREDKIAYDPVGWHNYKLPTTINGKKSENWLMNRGHLVGYLFSGLNSEGKNLVPITRYLNAGTMDDKKIDRSNYYSMIFYEMNLKEWLRDNSDRYLDYYVVPIYKGNDLLPNKIAMYWTAFDKNGNQQAIELKNKGQATTEGNISYVILDNTSPNATINYADGTAQAK